MKPLSSVRDRPCSAEGAEHGPTIGEREWERDVRWDCAHWGRMTPNGVAWRGARAGLYLPDESQAGVTVAGAVKPLEAREVPQGAWEPLDRLAADGKPTNIVWRLLKQLPGRRKAGQ